MSKVISSRGVPLSKTRTVTENRTTFSASSNEVTPRDKAGPGSHEAEEAAVSHHRGCETEGQGDIGKLVSPALRPWWSRTRGLFSSISIEPHENTGSSQCALVVTSS